MVGRVLVREGRGVGGNEQGGVCKVDRGRGGGFVNVWFCLYAQHTVHGIK